MSIPRAICFRELPDHIVIESLFNLSLAFEYRLTWPDPLDFMLLITTFPEVKLVDAPLHIETSPPGAFPDDVEPPAIISIVDPRSTSWYTTTSSYINIKRVRELTLTSSATTGWRNTINLHRTTLSTYSTRNKYIPSKSIWRCLTRCRIDSPSFVVYAPPAVWVHIHLEKSEKNQKQLQSSPQCCYKCIQKLEGHYPRPLLWKMRR